MALTPEESKELAHYKKRVSQGYSSPWLYSQIEALELKNSIKSEAPQPNPKPQRPKPAAPPQAVKPVRKPAGTKVVVPPNHPRARQTAQAVARGGALARGPKPGSTQLLKPKAVKAKPQAATPKGFDVNQAIDETLVPWSQRQDVPWGGGPNSVDRFRTEIQRLHDQIKGDLSTPIAQQEAKIRRFSGLRGENLEKFVKDARKGFAGNRVERMDLISTRGREGVWNGMLNASGNTVVGDNLGDVTGTDIFARVQGDVKGIDVHDTFTDNRQTVKLGLRKEIYDRSKNAMSTASGSDRIIDIFNRSGGYEDKLTQSRPGVIRGVNTEPQFVKDFLVGGTYDRVMRNGVEHPGNPRMFHKGYAVDLDVLRNNLMDATVEQIEKIDGARIYNYKSKFGIELPHKELVAFGDGESTRNLLLSSEVQEAVRDRGGKLYGGIPEPWVKGLKSNWRGGLTNTLLNGASREAGVKLGKGDYAGAAIDFGVEYGKGAVLEQGVRQVGKTGLWQGAKRIAGAVGKRLPASLARFKTGTAATGGLAAPLLGIATVVDVADGITEGVTGKGIYTRGLEAGERAEAKKRAAVAAGASKTDLRRAARRSQPIAVPKPVTEPVAVEPPAPTPVKAKQIAGAWQRRRGKK